MCGLVGFTGNKNITLLKKIFSTIHHRGPDEDVYFADNIVNAGMKRLAIIDLHKKLYPFRYKNLMLMFNGEIYNYRELRKVILERSQTPYDAWRSNRIPSRDYPISPKKSGLQDDNGLFKTNSDAEVILPLFDLYGPKAFKMLEAMFALFIYDTKNKIIYLARDKMGEKPMYYYHNDKLFAFGSELKTLLAFPNLNPNLNPTTICQYLHHSFIDAPNTIITNIKKIPAGHYLKVKLAIKKPGFSRLKPGFKVILKPYWQIQPQRPGLNVKAGPLHSQINRLDDLIGDSVKARLIADVPIGCFLSGGVDSSLITYFASRYKKYLHTFSVSFPGFEKYDESKYAQEASKLLKTKHDEVACTSQKIRPIIENIGKIIDEPIIDAAVLPLYILAQEARKKVKVVLTGDGADELFGGYPRYFGELILEKTRNFLSYIPKPIRSFLPYKIKYRLANSVYKHYLPQQVWSKEMLNKLIPGCSRFNLHLKAGLLHHNPLLYMQLVDLKGFLPEQMMMKADKITMYHSLETRSPYLDSNIVEFALSLPNKLKINLFEGKYILKKVAEKHLPQNLVWRKKHYFSVPLTYWFRNELKDLVYDSIAEVKKYLPTLNHKYYKFIINKHMNEKSDYNYPIWGMMVLAKWMKYHKLNF